MNNHLDVASDLCTQGYQYTARLGSEALDVLHCVLRRGREHSFPVLKDLYEWLAPCPIGQQWKLQDDKVRKSVRCTCTNIALAQMYMHMVEDTYM